MNQDKEFLVVVLQRTSRALAGYAASSLLEKHPEARASFGPDPLVGWQTWLTLRVEELASAVAVSRPRLFVSQIQWCKRALKARGISTESFHQGLKCLREVLRSELPEQVQPLAAEYLDHALEAFDKPQPDISTRLLPDTDTGRLASSYLLALLEGDRRRASGLILEALDRGFEVRDLYLQVLLPAQEELGRMWLTNEINVAEEHFSSQTTKMVMAQLLPRATLPAPNGKTMLAASVAGNQHDIGLQAVADFFEMDGWRTVLLGADVPAHELVQAIDYFQADLLGLSVSQTVQLQAVRTAIEAIRQNPRGTKVKILLGGRALDDSESLAMELGVDGYASHPLDAVSLGRELVGVG